MRRVLFVVALFVCAPGPRAAAQRFPPDSFTNLKVLPQDIPARELVNLMAGFTRALGVRCTHCHVGEEGRPLETYEFAKDDKLPKRKAREMLRMVEAINDQHLSKLEERAEPRITVTCATCHRGVGEPRPLQDILVAAYRAAGLDSALAAYRALRERYYGRAAYDFGEVPLADAATAVAGMNRWGDAVRLLELDLSYFPTSAFVQRQHAAAALRDAFEARGVAAGGALYRDLRARYQPDAFSDGMLNQIGYALLGQGRAADAVEVFKINVEAYPRSWNVYDSLGEAYAAVGDVRRAIEAYERSLALNPHNANAVRKLEELRRRGTR